MRIGSNNFIMNYVYIVYDVLMGDYNVIVNNV